MGISCPSPLFVFLHENEHTRDILGNVPLSLFPHKNKNLMLAEWTPAMEVEGRALGLSYPSLFANILLDYFRKYLFRSLFKIFSYLLVSIWFSFKNLFRSL